MKDQYGTAEKLKEKYIKDLLRLRDRLGNQYNLELNGPKNAYRGDLLGEIARINVELERLGRRD